uniref:putative receptor-like protein kinase At3g47110 n=1 Tax=Fragaria vesca subsp. vesca TaxID=101020 RepID=UPI0005C9560D|nr:PREDICTED: putative receptor-like protein kinase At3g47110 [Fragaria vesca subsp. vesca]
MDNFRYLHVLALLLFTNLLQPTAVVSSFVNETDHLALLKFKESIVADPHGFLNSWNDSVHFCKWGGVTCGRRHQRVTGLNLSDADLNGTISPYIGNLSFLRFISLPRNKFAGLIPQQVGQLFRLRRLHLDTNMLEGGIPVNLTFCPELSVISIRENRLKGDIPSEIGSLTKLVFLNLGRNNLTGRVPPNLGKNMPHLHTMFLGGNEFSGQIPASFANASKLRALDISKNNYVGQVPKKTQKSTKQLSALPSINFLSRVSYQRLHQATGGFSLSNQIGSGSVGSVYKGILDEQENSVVAIKVLNLEQKGAFKSFVAECNALRNIRHKNLVKILTCCSSTDHDGNDFKALVFEYKSNGSLEEWLHSENQSRSLNLLQRLNIAVDVASALCYLHDHCEPQIIHRDMKPSNVLLDEDMVACVSDFGLARLIPATADSSENLSSTVGINGTIGYAAPEYAVGVEPSTQGDVYSYGILVLQLFTGRRPTDQIFVDGDNIHTFVKTAIQGRIMQIVDPALIATREEETATSTTNNEGTKIDDHNNEIIVDEENVDSESLSKMNTYLWKCILPTLKIGVACSEESPRNRMSMEEVLRELHRIKNAYNAIPSREAKKKLNIRNSKVSLV